LNTQSEMFAIGSTVLQAGLLKNFNGVYKGNTFNENALN